MGFTEIRHVCLDACSTVSQAADEIMQSCVVKHMAGEEEVLTCVTAQSELYACK